jgi:hypothetical protein
MTIKYEVNFIKTGNFNLHQEDSATYRMVHVLSQEDNKPEIGADMVRVRVVDLLAATNLTYQQAFDVINGFLPARGVLNKNTLTIKKTRLEPKMLCIFEVCSVYRIPKNTLGLWIIGFKFDHVDNTMIPYGASTLKRVSISTYKLWLDELIYFNNHDRRSLVANDGESSDETTIFGDEKALTPKKRFSERLAEALRKKIKLTTT